MLPFQSTVAFVRPTRRRAPGPRHAPLSHDSPHTALVTVQNNAIRDVNIDG